MAHIILAMSIKQAVHEHSQGLAEAAKLSPPIGVLGSQAMGAQLQTWILWGTLIYTILLIVHKIFQIGKDIYKLKTGAPDSTSGDL